MHKLIRKVEFLETSMQLIGICLAACFLLTFSSLILGTLWHALSYALVFLLGLIAINYLEDYKLRAVYELTLFKMRDRMPWRCE